MFSAIAVTPTIIVAVFSALFFNIGVESWFDDRVRTAVSESLAVAEAYVQEHQNVIRGEILAMANDINREGGALLAGGVIERPIDPAAGMTDYDRAHLLSRGIGITNLVRRATARADDSFGPRSRSA